jgi:hypothetical protein
MQTEFDYTKLNIFKKNIFSEFSAGLRQQHKE